MRADSKHTPGLAPTWNSVGSAVAHPKFRKPILWSLLIVGGVLLCAFALFLSTPLAAIDQETRDRIKAGMTLADVQAIIGGPPGLYDGVWGMRTDAPVFKGAAGRQWVGSRGELFVWLSGFGEARVTGADFYPGEVTRRDLVRLVGERLTRDTAHAAEVGSFLYGCLFGTVAGGMLCVVFLYRRPGRSLFGLYLLLMSACLSLGAILWGVASVTRRNPQSEARLLWELRRILQTWVSPVVGTLTVTILGAYFWLGVGSGAFVLVSASALIKRRPRESSAKTTES
jgi:hypothetical protein